MRYCPGCGGEVEDGWGHCPDCGEELSDGKTESASQETTFPIGRKLTLGGLVLVAVGAFLPWVSVSVLGTTDSVIGMDTLGVFTLILAVLAGLVVLVSWSTAIQTLVFLAGIVVSGTAAYGIGNPAHLAEIQVSALDEGLVRPDNGLYATLLGAVIILVATGYALNYESQTSEGEDEEPGFFTLYWLPGFSK